MASNRTNGSGDYHLGIDLGTTYVAAGILRQGRPEIVTLGDRAPVVPSVLFFKDDGEVLHGESAARRGLSDPTRVAREFKRRVGDTTPMVVGQTPYSADVLLAKLLRVAHGAVVERQGGPPASIAITHPANWGGYKIDVLHQAVRMAEVGSVTTLTEPVAAAIHYAATERLEPGQTVAVYDLGGGTFDAAVLRRTASAAGGGGTAGDDFEVLGDVEGIERLGGIDFDEAVFHHAIRWCESEVAELDADDPAVVQALARLRQECIAAKEALSTDTDVSIPVVLPNVQTEVRLTRSEFEAMIRPLLQQTVDALRRAIRGSGVEVDDLTAVLLVGGSSRVPLIAEMVAAELGRPIAVDQHPKHTVALGAAIAAGRAAGDVVPTPAGSAAAAASASPGGMAGSAAAAIAAAPTGAPIDADVLANAGAADGSVPVADGGVPAEAGASKAESDLSAGESQLVSLRRGEGDGPRAVLHRPPAAAHVEAPSVPVVAVPVDPNPAPSAAPPVPSSTAPAASSRPTVSDPAPTTVAPVGLAPSRVDAGGPARPFDHRDVLAGSPGPAGGGGSGGRLLVVAAAVIVIALVAGGVWALTRSGGDETVAGDQPDDPSTPTTVDPSSDGADDETATTADPTATTVGETTTTEQATTTTEAETTTTEAESTTTVPAGPSAEIGGITVDGGSYAVAYTTTFDPVISGDPATHHLHFFFDTVGVDNAGTPGSGPWILYDGPSPFRGYGPADRPSGATQLCVTVATHDHAVDDATVFDCMDLPG